MKLLSPTLFPIKCSCNGDTPLNHLENNTWVCWSCSTKYEIEVPDGYEVCKTCLGGGQEPGRLMTSWFRCEKCKGTGLISWTEKVLG